MAIEKNENFLEELRATSTSLSDVSFTVQDLKLLTQNVSAYIVRNEAETPLYGRICVQDKEVKIYCFQTQTPEELHKILPIDGLLNSSCFNTEFQPPYTKRGFLKFRDTEDGTTFEVAIRIKDGEPRGRNFLLLCAGIKGPSYKGTRMHYGCEGFFIPPFFSLSPTDAPPSMVEINDCDTSWATMKKGLIHGMQKGKSEFQIWMCDNPSGSLSDPVGHVETGLHHLEERQTKGRLLEIVDGGLIF